MLLADDLPHHWEYRQEQQRSPLRCMLRVLLLLRRPSGGGKSRRFSLSFVPALEATNRSVLCRLM
jgi:hypothetical protein